MTANESMQSQVTRRDVLKGCLVAAATVATTSALIPVARASTKDVEFQLGWLASNGNMGETVAKSLGYFEEEKINLTITPGGPNIEGVQSVAAGRALIGQASSSPMLMFARSAGIPVRGIAAGFRPHPFSYFSLPRSPIRTPQDLIGKTVATPKGAHFQLRALLAKHGIPEDKVNVKIIGADYSLLVRGAVDSVAGWFTNTKALEVLGPDVITMRFWDVGIRVYANTYYVSDKGLDENFDTIAGFVRAASKGWAYVYNNPEKAVDLLVGEYPNLDRDVELRTVPIIRNLAYNDATREGGWGTMEKENWAQQIQDYAAIDQFKGRTVPAVEDVMTLSVLDATAEARPKLG